MSLGDKLLNGAFHSVSPRTAGFNTLDMGALRVETLAVNYVLMFIGGGSAGTAGGIKVTTFFLLGLVVWSEIRGERDVAIFGRRIGNHVQRQALTIVLLAIGLVGTGTLIVLGVTDLPFEDVMFETISAFATVGLSTGITAGLPPSAQSVIIVLMFVGRVGTHHRRHRARARRRPPALPLSGGAPDRWLDPPPAAAPSSSSASAASAAPSPSR